MTVEGKTPMNITFYFAKSGRWIDTSGYSPADSFSGRPEIEQHLVLSAAMGPADLSGVVHRFAVFAPTHLFTHFDEASASGPIINETCRTGWRLTRVAPAAGGVGRGESIAPRRLAA